MKKICFVTGGRSDYDILYPLMKYVSLDANLQFQLIATGSHFSHEYGVTYKKIEDDGFYIDKKIEMLLDSNTEVSVIKSMGVLMISIADTFAELRPDIVVALGDRFEMFTAVSAAIVFGIPIVHIYGGEITEGSIDDSFRHSITKMSNLHLVSTEVAKLRVVQMGESPSHVHVIGSMGVENIGGRNYLSKVELEKKLNIKFREKNLLITYHPETVIGKSYEKDFLALLSALDHLDNSTLIFTAPNCDSGSALISKLISSFVESRPNAYQFKSLGQDNYLSCLHHCDGVIGNSSSGIIEAPSMHKGTINIGSRQAGREKALSVITCNPNSKEIIAAINQMYSVEFNQILKNVKNPYESKKTPSEVAANLIKKYLNEGGHRKIFNDQF